ncbi:MAG: hypothetical protein LBB25_02890 [Holosporaceae bacterium]|jgi:hypothetical protein|nr:hypothetical protein [Holosporaceae bacterium]
MRKIVFSLFFFFSTTDASSIATGSVLAMSAASSLKTLSSDKESIFSKFFSPKKGLLLEKVTISTEDDMNNHAAVKFHIVIIYDQELLDELKKMSASEYFHTIIQLVRDNPDKMKIFEWQLSAQKRKLPASELEYEDSNMVPLAAIAYGNYGSPGAHRVTVPPTAKSIRVSFEKQDFRVEEKK